MLTPTIFVGVIVALTIATAFARHRDTFHPALLIGPMLGFHYCYSPLVLEADNSFSGFLWDDQVAYAQWIHLTGVLALCAGLLSQSARPARPAANLQDMVALFDRKMLAGGAMAMAGAGIASFVYGIVNVGGFSKAYGRAYGGGFSASGWVRELALLCLPALLLFIISRQGRRFTARVWVQILVMASPLWVHGLLGARRGPTFMAVVGSAMVFYMARDKRPRILTLVAGGALLGVVMLGLVSNRSSVYWGAELESRAESQSYFLPGAGNDFIYSAGLIIVTEELQNFTWGTTYLTTLFVRPIPKEIWPTKYQDAAEYFGRPLMDENLGVDITSFRTVLGWTAAFGAAPGIVGDMWHEFSWGMLVPLFGLGWFYAYAWRRAIAERGVWLPIYCLMASLSIYLVMQTLEAMLFRFLFGVVPMLYVLWRAKRAARPPVLASAVVEGSGAVFGRGT